MSHLPASQSQVEIEGQPIMRPFRASTLLPTHPSATQHHSASFPGTGQTLDAEDRALPNETRMTDVGHAHLQAVVNMDGSDSHMQSPPVTSSTPRVISEKEHLKYSVFLHPKSKERTWPLLPVACERWPKEEYDLSFTKVVEYLKGAVDQDKALHNSARNILYRLMMVGLSSESVKPSILVLCKSSDKRSLKSLLRDMPSQYNCIIPSMRRSTELSKLEPILWLYLCPTSSKPFKKKSGVPVSIECSSLATMCGSLVEFKGRQSTISLTLDIDGEGRLLTVDHIFQDNESEDDEPQMSLDPESSASIESNIEQRDCFNDSKDDISMDLDTESNHDDTQMDRELPTTCVDHSSSQVIYEPTIVRTHAGFYRFSRYYHKPGERVEPPNSLPRRSPYLDWACLCLLNTQMTERQRSNLLVRPGKPPVPLEGFATKPRTHAVPIFMISGVVGVRSGRLIELPSYLGSSKEQDLCETWTIILDQQEGFHPGESGSIVVDQETFKIYGHLVGSDMFGYGHVVPFSRTIEQIKTAFNVDNAGLPTRGNHGPHHEGDMGSKDDEELVLLLRAGWPDIFRVQQLIERGADVNRPDTSGETPLWRAAREGNQVIVELLLENGADLSMPSIYCETPLWGAVGAGHLDIAKLLLEHGADPSALNEYGETLLWRSASRGHIPIMKFLLENGADLSIPDKYGQTPLWIAAENGFLPVVQLLLSLGSEVDCKDEHNRTPLWRAIHEGHQDIVKVLVEAGADIHACNEDGQTPLHLAAAGGHYDIFELLRKAGAKVNTKDDAVRAALLSIAIKEGHSDHLQQLIKAGAELNVRDKNGCMPLLIAIKEGHSDIIQQLLEAGAELNVSNENGDTPLLIAMRNKHLHIIPQLIEAGANVNAGERDGCTPLLIATQEGRSSVCEQLIKAGALLNIKDKKGRTALFTAVQEGNRHMTQLLIEGGAEVNARDKNGCTPLFGVAENGYSDICKQLIEAGALLDNKNNQGRTALFSAVLWKKKDVVQMLIEGGAATDVKDIKGKTLHMLAEECGIDLSLYLARAEDSVDEGKC